MSQQDSPQAPDASQERLRRAGVAAWSILGILLLLTVFMWLLYQIREIFPPLVLALAIIFILNPLVTGLEGRGVPRTVGTLGIYLVFLVLVVLLGLWMTPLLMDEFRDFGEAAPGYFNDLTQSAEGLAARFGISFDEVNVPQLIEQGREQLFTGVNQVLSVTRGAIHVLLIFVLAPIFAVYLLIDLPRLQRAFVRHLPPKYREEWLMLLERSGRAVGSFFRGQLLVALIVGAMSSVGLLIAGIEFWLPIGLAAGFFNIIPFIGPIIGGLLAVAVGGITGGLSKAVLGGLVMLIVQQIDNHLISPNVMGRAVKLHPVTIMVALIAGATVAGFWGMLLAVPATAVAKILGLHYYYRHVLGEVEEEGDLFEDEAEPKRRRRRKKELAASAGAKEASSESS